MKYERLEFVSPEATLREVASAESARVVPAVLAAALESPDRLWIEACAISLSLSADPAIRRTALLALGHLARRFREADTHALRLVLERAAEEPVLSATVADVVDDLKVLGLSPEA